MLPFNQVLPQGLSHVGVAPISDTVDRVGTFGSRTSAIRDKIRHACSIWLSVHLLMGFGVKLQIMG
jgi:hypothetical protein